MADTDLQDLLRPRVERGAALLDSVEPYWWKRIEVALNLAACDRCVLGQVFGGYSKGLTELFGSGPGASLDHGFTVNTDPDPAVQASWKVLDALWLEAIEARRLRP